MTDLPNWMSLGLKESLAALVKAKYTSAKTAGALTYADSHLAVVPIADLPFQLRFCPALAKKPVDQKSRDFKAPKSKTDPFENPDPQLLVCTVPDQTHPSHRVVLNKFPIIQNHFILATLSAKLQQSQLLDEDDLLRTYQCLADWESPGSNGSSGGKVFAFFNSGEHSGASQPHRHVQFLPVEDMQEGDSGGEWSLLISEILNVEKTKFASYEFNIHPHLPFVHFGKAIPSSCDAQTLWTTYMDLYKATLASVRRFRISHPDELLLHSTNDSASPISYNFAMTTDGMVMCPRRREGQIMRRPDGSELDYVALNGTLLGGTLMVKNEELFQFLQKDSAALGHILEVIGIESKYGKLDHDDLEPDTATLKFTL